jgi:small-conductance mechanosensitive channel
MNTLSETLQNSLAQLSTPQYLAQILILIVAVALAVLLGHAARLAWQRRAAPRLAWQATALEASVVLTPALCALMLLLGTHALYVARNLNTTVLDMGLQLAAALLLVRLGTFAIGLLVGPQSWVHKWEARLTLIVWLAIAFQVVGWFDAIERALDSIDLLPGKTQFSLWSLLKGLFVVTGFIVIMSVIARAIERRVMKLDTVALSTRIGISKFSYFFLISMGTLLGINAAGVDLTALTVLTGAIGLGLGFGLQAIASNFVSGFVLLLDKSIKPGDVISFTGVAGTSTENFGWVQELRGRYVVVRDRDGVETLVPNQNLITNAVINWSYSDRKVRIKLPVRISYRDDPELALSILMQAIEGHRRVLHDPAPVTRLMQFADFGMDLELRFWIADPENGVNNVRSDVNRRIWRLFRDAGITIPVSQHDVRLLPAGDAGAAAIRDPRDA